MGAEQKIWEYYEELAKKSGTNSKGNETGYSIWWIYRYFKADLQGLNQITQAFLDMTSPLSLNDTVLPARFDIHDFLVEPAPNPEQEQAIRTALAKPVSFIQGPPGTGKSRTILNIMSCIVNGLGRTVAMVSANNAAVDVISGTINGYGTYAGPAGALVQNRANLNESFAALGSISQKLKEYNETHTDFSFKAGKDEELGVRVVKNVSFADFSRRHKAITSTIHSLKKLFAEGPGLQYDYVIMDESSQVTPVLGLIAMTSARHLILVGDRHQLPPIVSDDDVNEANRAFPSVPDLYQVKDDSNLNMPSILTMCLKRFKDVNARVMLKEHYRCHPGIIEFCNANVYGGDLRINTGGSSGIDTLRYKVPIKVIWYQGYYCEPVDLGKDEQTDITKRNGKQITVFVEEELPNLICRIMNPNDTMDSFSVLSPFRGVLTELADKIDATLTEAERNVLTVTVNEPEKDDGEEGRFSFRTLTVYKSQGREYDVIYLLPAEDQNWERPWSQGKNLINVAVSRAKEELRIIVSTALMSEGMQMALSGAKKAIPETSPCPENFRYVQKLIDYTKIANDSDSDYNRSRADWDPKGKYESLHDPTDPHYLRGIPFDFPVSRGTSPVDFGFYQSTMKSVFDPVPVIRRDTPEVANDMECPLQCLLNAILSVPEFTLNKYHLYTDVMLFDFEQSEGGAVVSRQEIWDMLERAGYSTPDAYRIRQDHLELHMDIAICNNDKRVLMMIELDGGFHRYSPQPEKLEKQRINDCAKDELMGRYFTNVPFLRIKTDGTDHDEKQKIEDILRQGAVSGICCPAKKLTELYSPQDADKLRIDLLGKGYLEKRPLYKLKTDGLSWEVLTSPKKDYLRPTVKGTSIGIVRHYGVSEKDNGVFMNQEYLPRFSVK